MEKCPGGQRFRVCISNTWEYLYTVFSPVVVTPRISTVPSVSTSQLKSPAPIYLTSKLDFHYWMRFPAPLFLTSKLYYHYGILGRNDEIIKLYYHYGILGRNDENNDSPAKSISGEEYISDGQMQLCQISNLLSSLFTPGRDTRNRYESLHSPMSISPTIGPT